MNTGPDQYLKIWVSFQRATFCLYNILKRCRVWSPCHGSLPKFCLWMSVQFLSNCGSIGTVKVSAQVAHTLIGNLSTYLLRLPDWFLLSVGSPSSLSTSDPLKVTRILPQMSQDLKTSRFGRGKKHFCSHPNLTMQLGFDLQALELKTGYKNKSRKYTAGPFI